MSDKQEQGRESVVPDEKPSELVVPDGVPDVYADGTRFFLSPYGLTVYLQQKDHLQEPDRNVAHLVCKVNMSHAQAWVFSVMLSRLLDRYVREVGPIPLPKKLVADLKLEDEYREMQRREED